MDNMNFVTEHLAKTNNADYNFDKLMEEMHELAEVILKRRNKKGHVKEPPLQDLIDELGDVKLRLEVVIKQVDETAVSNRVGKKAEAIANSIQTKQHTGRI